MSDWQLLWEDEFAGPDAGSRWVGGQLRPSAQMRLQIDHGVHVRMAAGGPYASGGVVTTDPIAGDFAAEVAFSVAAPHAGSTLELAAIRPGPPAHSILNPTTKAQGALVFNVHGEPPYVSSEFDENDGWRIGWNAQAPQFKIDENGEPYADGVYNKYGVNTRRDGYAGPTEGWLWLERTAGSHWRARGRHATADPWLDLRPTNALAALDVDFLAGPVHLRLVAKHWRKPAEDTPVPPANTVVFRHFRLYRKP